MRKTSIRQKVLGIKLADNTDLSDKYIIITGCSLGSLGYATAKLCLKQGAIVCITCRSSTDLAAKQLAKETSSTIGKDIFYYDLELTNNESINRFVHYYEKTIEQLDLLINNAGVHLDLLSEWKEPQLTNDNIEIHWHINFLGTITLTQKLLPLLIKQAKLSHDCRVINIVSMLHKKADNDDILLNNKTYNSWRAYGRSKLALIHYTKEFNKRFKAKGLSSYSLHPGGVYTNIASKGLAGKNTLLIIRNSFSFIEKFFLKTPEEGAQTIMYCINSKKENLIGGGYYNNCQIGKPNQAAQDHEASEKIWRKWIEPLS